MKNVFAKFIAFSAFLFWVFFTVHAQTKSPQSGKTATPEHIMLKPGAMKWVAAPNSLPPGAKVAILEGDPAKAGPFTIRVMAPANYKIMPHYHPGIEHVTIIEGELFMGHGDKFDETKATSLPAGSFSAIPIKMHHYAFTKSKTTILQLHGIGPWDIIYLDPANDPRTKKKK